MLPVARGAEMRAPSSGAKSVNLGGAFNQAASVVDASRDKKGIVPELCHRWSRPQ